MNEYLSAYTTVLQQKVDQAQYTDAAGQVIASGDALEHVLSAFRRAHEAGGRMLLIGNGGSAAIASHQAFDYWKNGKMRAMSFNDSSLLTGGANDFGYEHAFEETLKMHARKEDVLVAISSSGQSKNIINAATAARQMGLMVVTMSAFKSDNPLRSCGDVNVYLATDIYGHAELGHETILHTILDFSLEIQPR